MEMNLKYYWETHVFKIAENILILISKNFSNSKLYGYKANSHLGKVTFIIPEKIKTDTGTTHVQDGHN